MIDWNQLRDETTPILWGIAYRILVHYDDARDCVQDVYLEAIEKSRSQTVQNWPGYLRWLVTYRALDAVRRRRMHEHCVESVSSAPALNSVEIEDDMTVVREELKKLPIDQATAFWMYYIEEQSMREIAQCMCTTENAVRILSHRAKKQLQRRLRHWIQP